MDSSAAFRSSGIVATSNSCQTSACGPTIAVRNTFIELRPAACTCLRRSRSAPEKLSLGRNRCYLQAKSEAKSDNGNRVDCASGCSGQLAFAAAPYPFESDGPLVSQNCECTVPAPPDAGELRRLVTADIFDTAMPVPLLPFSHALDAASNTSEPDGFGKVVMGDASGDATPFPPQLNRLVTWDDFDNVASSFSKEKSNSMMDFDTFNCVAQLPQIITFDHFATYGTWVVANHLEQVGMGGLPIAVPMSNPTEAPQETSAHVVDSAVALLEDAPQPQTVVRSVEGGVCRIHWTVDARKLTGSDKSAVSPAFELFSAAMPFKMIIYSTTRSAAKGGGSFKNAKGKGYVQLKCEGLTEMCDSCVVTFQISISSGRWENALRRPPRGPLRHNFRQSGVCGLPKGEDVWDFSSVVDAPSQTFVVCLDVLSQSAL